MEKKELLVVDEPTGYTHALTDFVNSLINSGYPPEIKDQVMLRASNKRAVAALSRIAISIGRGENLKVQDIMDLHAMQLEGIKLRGDNYLYNLAANIEGLPMHVFRRKADDYCGFELRHRECMRPACRCWPGAGRDERSRGRGRDRTFER